MERMKLKDEKKYILLTVKATKNRGEFVTKSDVGSKTSHLGVLHWYKSCECAERV